MPSIPNSDANERRRYEGTGHGGTLEQRTAAFRSATDTQTIRAKNQAEQLKLDAIANVRERLSVMSAYVQVGKFTTEECDRQARALVDAVLCLTKALAPARFRDVSPQELARLCICGTSYREHYDGWDQNRLDCEEARRRAGGRA